MTCQTAILQQQKNNKQKHVEISESYLIIDYACYDMDKL